MAAIASYSTLSIFVAMIDLYIAWRVYTHRPDGNRQLARCCVLSAVVALSYLTSILTYDRTVTSIACSVYFAAIDWILYNLIHFVQEYTGRERNKVSEMVQRGFLALAGMETVLFALNPVFGFSIGYTPRDTVLAHFAWEMKPPYFVHLAFTYAMVVIALWMLSEKAWKTPRQYRRQFSTPMIVILLVVLINAAFLFLPDGSILSLLDVSIFGYSAALLSLFWGRYYYAKHNMLEGLSRKIFDDIDQALVLFDYNGRLIMQNQQVGRLLCPDGLPQRMPLADFITEYCPSMEGQENGDRFILQCALQVNGETRTLRCDYSRLRDKSGKVIGILFAFADAQMETDILTGFHMWDDFRRRLQSEPQWITGPTTVAAFDINNLSAINSGCGRDEGDRRMQELAEQIRKTMPTGTYFVRGVDASLIAMFHREDESGMIALAEKVEENFPDRIQFSVSSVPAEGSVSDCIQQAENGLKVKKLLDSDSGRSQLLRTLVQALQECDSDTEAHVQRTRRMGAALGKRLSLSDVQQGQLSLLCLLHDIGKIGIPLEILNKPGRLSDEEWTVLRSHVEKGYQIAMSSVHLQGIAELILRHHERWDGRGYPGGFSGEEIPLLSRIIAVVDAYDAMVNNRSYRRGISREKAIEELRACAGSQFDPNVVEEFIAVLNDDPDIDGVTSASEGKPADAEQNPAPDEPDAYDAESAVSRTISPVRFSRYLLDQDNRIVQVDDAFFEMTGYTAEDVAVSGLTQSDLLPEEERPAYQQRISELLTKNTILYLEHPLRHKDGSVGYVFCYGKQYYDSAARTGRSEIIITESTRKTAHDDKGQKAESQKMTRMTRWEDLCRRDTLTGLLTHEAYRSDVEQMMLCGEERMVLLLIDLDNFRRFNARYGQTAGDNCLIAVAKSLTNALRKDDLACRIGGDEFSAALLFDLEVPEEVIERRIREIFEEVEDETVKITGCDGISMGAALSDGYGGGFHLLYQIADLAVHDAKNSGCGRVVIYRSAGPGTEQDRTEIQK